MPLTAPGVARAAPVTPPVARGRGLLLAAHPGPTVAVTTLAGLLGWAVGLGPRSVLVAAAVLSGQLTIGWGNDLRDAARDRAVGRRDKPLATGAVPARWVAGALAGATVVCVALSAALGWRSAAVHLLLLVGSGHAYNLGLKATAWSAAPYAVAFGALPSVVTLAGPDGRAAPGWMTLVGACLGVAAHVLNVLPDLADDARTGVRGLPHRLGATRSRLVAAVLLLGATAAAVLLPPGPAPAAGWLVLAAAVLLAPLTARPGRTPFRVAVAIALLAAGLLVVVAR